MDPMQLSSKIVDDIRYQILSNQLLPGDKLPSERELAANYKVQRLTVRKALQELILLEEISSVRNTGYFVSPNKIERKNSNLNTIAQDIYLAGFNTEIAILSSQSLIVDRKLSSKFKVSIGKQIYEIRRLVLINNQPIVIETYKILKDELMDIEINDMKQIDFTDVLTDKYGLTIKKIESELKIVFSNDFEKYHLKLAKDQPLLKEEGIIFNNLNEPLIYCEHILLPDYFIYTS